MATRAPTAASAVATTRPIPLAPPVTTATSPSRRNSDSGSITIGAPYRGADDASVLHPPADPSSQGARERPSRCRRLGRPDAMPTVLLIDDTTAPVFSTPEIGARAKRRELILTDAQGLQTWLDSEAVGAAVVVVPVRPD